MAPWVGYVRVSFVGERAGESFRSPDDQASAIRAWARARREKVVVLEPELDESGGRADRPILAEAIAGIEAGRYRGLVVAYLSRASRSTRHLLELWDRIEAAGGQVVAVAENVDTSTPAGRLTRTMLAAIAEHELDLHRERFEELRRSSTERGIWQRRQTPRGYERDPDRRLVPDADAKLVRQAFLDRARGVSVLELAERMRMTTAGVRALLRNRVYLGELRVGKHVKVDAHPALLSPEQYEAAQRALRRRGAVRANPALLTSLVRCQSCGHRMTCSNGSYLCVRQHSAGRCPKPAAITAAIVEPHVEAVALAELGRLEVVRDDGRALSDARAALAAAERELAGFLEAVALAELEPADYAAGARLRRAARDAARERVESLVARQGAIDSDARALWPKLDTGERNHVLGGLLECILVRPVGRGRRVAVGERTRVIAHGAGIEPTYPGGGRPLEVRALPFPDADDERVLGMARG